MNNSFEAIGTGLTSFVGITFADVRSRMFAAHAWLGAPFSQCARPLFISAGSERPQSINVLRIRNNAALLGFDGLEGMLAVEDEITIDGNNPAVDASTYRTAGRFAKSTLRV